MSVSDPRSGEPALPSSRSPMRWAALLLIAIAPACGGPEDTEARPPIKDAALDTATDTATEAAAEASVPDCTPVTCASVGAKCGTIPDGCGDKIACGTCAAGERCGGGGPNLCGAQECYPKTCAQLGASCGYVSDMCSEALDCGACAVPQVCGGGGKKNQCGCQPKTCAQLDATCGTAPDGCGGILNCGNCASGQTCGGGGQNRCGSAACNAKSCAQIGASCGIVSDGCSEALDCGKCTAPDVCGGLGKLNQCGCIPKTCAQLGASCGSAPTGCGYEVDCGTCPNGEECGSGGVPNQCGCNCTLPHASTACQSGQCVITGCDPGWDDCDGNAANGCEGDLNAEPNCGVCGKTCDDGNACTMGDACQSGSCVSGTPKTCNDPPGNPCLEASGSCDPGSGNCVYPNKANGTQCGSTTCDGWGTCSWNGECSGTGSHSRTCTEYKCSAGTCSPSSYNDSEGCTRTVNNGTPCSAGYCCSNNCVAKNDHANCGACGVDCGEYACVKISGKSFYTCSCYSNDWCRSHGFGPKATCYTYNGQSLCNCQCDGDVNCTGQCAGGATCAEVSYHNYCFY
ncbi:MAG TPA: hypothetical protein PLI95_15085 [Polyangiaceae bacterium]|nr:hypothetical protein [Polyangiaceae bacterium]